MLSKKNSMVTMVTDEFLENRIILQKSVTTIGFIWFFWFQKCILLYIFAQVFLVMRSIRSHISLFRLGFTPTLIENYTFYRKTYISHLPYTLHHYKPHELHRVISLNFWWGGNSKFFVPVSPRRGRSWMGGGLAKRNPTEAETAHLMQN